MQAHGDNPDHRGDASTAGAVACRVIAADAARVRATVTALGGNDAAGTVAAAHEAVQRLRADLRGLRPVLDRAWTDGSRAALETASEALAAIADVDARAALLGAADETGTRTDRVAGLRSALAGLGAERVLPAAPGDVPTRGSDSDAAGPAAAVLPVVLRRPWRRVRDVAKPLADVDRPGDAAEELARWARRCRDLAAALEPELGPAARVLAVAADSVHREACAHHDAAVLRAAAADATDTDPTAAAPSAVAAALHGRADRLLAGARLADAVVVFLDAKAATKSPVEAPVTAAAGGVVARSGRRGVEVALVHRPKHGDWSLPKGCALPGEDAVATARREVEEETGWRCTFGDELPPVRYRDRSGRRKTVRYFTMAPVAPGRRLPGEVDAVAWWPLEEALRQAGRPRDRSVLASYAAAAADLRAAA